MAYLTDIEIAQQCKMQPITEIAKSINIDDKYIEQYGKYKAKVDYSLLKESDRKDGKLILVTAITPTPAGEAKLLPPQVLQMDLRRLAKTQQLLSVSHLWDPFSVLKVEQQAVDTLKLFLWKTSTYTLRATSTQQVLQTTFSLQ